MIFDHFYLFLAVQSLLVTVIDSVIIIILYITIIAIRIIVIALLLPSL